MTIRKMSFVTAAIIGAVLLFYVAVAGLLVHATEAVLVLFVAVLYGIFLRHTGLWFEKKLPISSTVGVAISATLQLLAVAAALFFGSQQIYKQIERSVGKLDEARTFVREELKSRPKLRDFLEEEPSIARLLKLSDSDPRQDRSPASSANSGGDGSQSKGDDSQSESDSSQSDDKSRQRPRTSPSQATGVGSSLAANASATATKAVTTTFGLIANVLIVFFVGLYLALDPALYRRGFLKLLPERSRETAGDVLGQLDTTLWNWLLGRFATMAITGIGVGLVLWLIGIPMAVTLGVVTGLLTFVPNIGPIIALSLAALVALPLGMTKVAYTVVGYVLFQLLESYVLTPMIQKHQIAMPPAVILIAQLLLGVVAGFLGIAVATPLVAVAMVVIGILYVERHLGEDRSIEDCPGA